MNQKTASKKSLIVDNFYNNLDNTLIALPMYVMVAMRKTPCEYCDNPIVMGELRISVPTTHIGCFIERLTLSTKLIKRIEQKLIEQGMENE